MLLAPVPAVEPDSWVSCPPVAGPAPAAATAAVPPEATVAAAAAIPAAAAIIALPALPPDPSSGKNFFNEAGISTATIIPATARIASAKPSASPLNDCNANRIAAAVRNGVSVSNTKLATIRFATSRIAGHGHSANAIGPIATANGAKNPMNSISIANTAIAISNTIAIRNRKNDAIPPFRPTPANSPSTRASPSAHAVNARHPASHSAETALHPANIISVVGVWRKTSSSSTFLDTNDPATLTMIVPTTTDTAR